jgi:two-component system nitrate/nitrite response regulator NarL
MIGQTTATQQPVGAEHPAGGNQSMRVLIADRDPLARSVIRASLHATDRLVLVATAGDARRALEIACFYRPAVLVVDTALPPDGAAELIGSVRLVSPETRAVTVAVDDQHGALAAFRAGAVGHIDKHTDPDELACLVVRAADGEAVVQQQLIMPLLELVREVPDRGWRPLHSRLTTREWEIVELLTANASTEQIAEHLVLTHDTIYSHVKSVMRKLDVHTRRDAVAAATVLRKEEASIQHTFTQTG